MDRVSVALAPTLSLHIRLDLESAALQDADMDAPRAELAGEGDAGRAGADHTNVSADVLAVGLGHQLGSDRHGTNSSSARVYGRPDWPTAKDVIDAGLHSPLVGRHQIGDRIDGLLDGRRIMGGAHDE